MESFVFFDSWGQPHINCDASHPDAGAFGPAYVSRPLTEVEVRLLGLADPEATPWSVAKAAGRIEAVDDWDFLVLREDDFVF